MNQSEESQQQQQEEVINGSAQVVYGLPHYHAGAGVATATPLVPTSVPNGSTSQHQYYQQQEQRHQSQLQEFWDNQILEIGQTTDFKNHSLPLARIKKIMKADEDVRMISSEAPVVFAKACEMFIMELTKRSWMHTEENKRRTLQKKDISAAISKTDVYDFLVDIIPRDELREEGPSVTRAAVPLLVPPADSGPYYYVPQHQQQHAMGQGGFYPDQHPHPLPPYMPWQHPQQHQNQEENDN